MADEEGMMFLVFRDFVFLRPDHRQLPGEVL
jgi:hypothetical protein